MAGLHLAAPPSPAADAAVLVFPPRPPALDCPRAAAADAADGAVDWSNAAAEGVNSIHRPAAPDDMPDGGSPPPPTPRRLLLFERMNGGPTAAPQSLIDGTTAGAFRQTQQRPARGRPREPQSKGRWARGPSDPIEGLTQPSPKPRLCLLPADPEVRGV